jgi:hypothetical protein
MMFWKEISFQLDREDIQRTRIIAAHTNPPPLAEFRHSVAERSRHGLQVRCMEVLVALFLMPCLYVIFARGKPLPPAAQGEDSPC